MLHENKNACMYACVCNACDVCVRVYPVGNSPEIVVPSIAVLEEVEEEEHCPQDHEGHL